MDKDSKIYVAGHTGMVGSSIVRMLQKKGYNNLLFKSSKELDLKDANSVDAFFKKNKPEYVYLAAAKVGGILANNKYRAEFIFDNLSIQNNVIHSSHKYEVSKLLFLGSSCIYPRMAPQPIKEEYLLTGSLEKTNEPYAIAKIAGLKMCEAYKAQYGCDFITVMPTNLYGPNDNYDLLNSHVLPALIRKFHEAKLKKSDEVEVWGTGLPKREFLYVDDLAEACYFLMNKSNNVSNINIGTGEDISIKELATLIKKVTNFDGNIKFDSTKPDGTPRKLLDVSLINKLGWKHKINLLEGLEMTYKDYLQKISK